MPTVFRQFWTDIKFHKKPENTQSFQTDLAKFILAPKPVCKRVQWDSTILMHTNLFKTLFYYDMVWIQQFKNMGHLNGKNIIYMTINDHLLYIKKTTCFFVWIKHYTCMSDTLDSTARYEIYLGSLDVYS